MSNLNFLFPGDEVKEGVCLVDMSQIALASCMATFEKEKVSLSMVRHIVLNSIKTNVIKFRKQGYSKVVICFDNANGGYWRRQHSPYYKKNRSKGREEQIESGDSFDWDGYFDAMKIITEEFKSNIPYYIQDITGVEADDHIGVISKLCFELGIPVMVVSSDGDFTQLHKYPNVSQYSPMQKKLVKSKTGSPALDLATKVLKGDRKDNVASVKVRGDFWSTRIEGERTPSMKSKFIEEFSIADEETRKGMLTEAEYLRYKENQILIDMDHIRPDIVASITKMYNEYQPAPKGKLYSYFVKSGLSKLINDINNF